MFYGMLRAFDETARAGSIRRASEALGVAPSSVSRNISVLEREIGTALMARSAAGVSLTHAGRLVAEYARAVLQDYDALRADLDDMRGTQRRLLNLALVESVASYGPIDAIGRFRERYPSVSFNLRLMPAPQIIDALRKDKYDIGVAFCAEPAPDIAILASVPEPIMLAVPPGHKLALADTASLGDLAGVALALPDSDFGVRRIFDQTCARAGLAFSPALTSNVFETLRDFVRRGAGAAILPRRAILRRQWPADLAAVPIAEPEFRDTTIDIVVRRRRLPRVVKAFADMLVGEIKSMP
ncbi:MAG TPA: LysR family transcriptional regulator [Rhizomicrobium sp.]|jgi:DNA-binding transcriptional LysR family regulator|nr:LysR family transcriptional regulator [Rhizomicrobium sp.]